MASPFTIFRRHQRVMIAALTLLAMFAFVFLDPLLDHLGGGGNRNPVVITTDAFGDLDENDLDSLRRQRQLILRVMERTLVEGGIHPTLASYQIMQVFGPPDEEAVVQSWLLAQRAEDLGMVVDERAIRDFLSVFLQQLTENQIGLGEIAAILQQDGIPQRIFFNALQQELLARQFRQSFQGSLWAVPPMQRWDYYRRLNQRANIELTPISVAKYMSQIEDPGDEVLRAFFEEHKDTEQRRDSPEPGFRQPEKVALQYFKANLNDFVRPDAVTDEEVREYYEKNKDTLFSMPQTPVAEAPVTPEASQPSEKPGEADAPTEEPATEQPGDPQASEAEEMEATEPLTLPTEEDAGSEKETEDTEQAEKAEKAEPEPAKQPADAPATPEEPKTDSDGAALDHRHGGVRFLLASYQEEAEKTRSENDKPDQEATPADANETPMSEASDAAEPDAAPAEPEAAATEPEAAKAESEGSGATASEADDAKPAPEAGPAAPEAGPAAPEPSTIDGRPTASPRYRPLAEVEGQIRETLARRKAHESVEERLHSLSSRIRNYHDELTRYEVHKEDDPTVKKPAELDLAQLAKDNNLEFIGTPPVTAWEASQLAIGSSLVGGATPFILAAFEKLPPFQPSISQAGEDYFLFWTTQKEEGRVPEWAEEGMRDEVLETWKRVEARSLARTAAEELAKKVRESGKTLEEFFADDQQQEVIDAGPFTWMTFGDIPPSLAREPPRVSEVEGVDGAGSQFMRDVFSLAEGETGTTMNQAETFAYVVRMESLAPPQNILWEGFLVDDFQTYFPVSIADLQQMQRTWMKGIEEAAGLQWKREPQRSRDND